MSEITIEKIAKTVETVVKQELEPIKVTLKEHTETLNKHTSQLDGLAKDVKTLLDHKTVSDYRLDSLEEWGVKTSDKTGVRLHL